MDDDRLLLALYEYIERDRKERFAVGDGRANAAIHLLISMKERGMVTADGKQRVTSKHADLV